MIHNQTSPFISAIAGGKDWREASKAVLQQLEAVKGKAAGYNLGFLYITDALADDASSILNLFRSVLDIEHWSGACGISICGSGQSFVDEPAISVMIGAFDPAQFCVFGAETTFDDDQEPARQWLKEHDPMLCLVHGDPGADDNPAHRLEDISAVTGGFLAGGLSSSRGAQIQFANDVQSGGLSGVLFSQNLPVATTLSQGCRPISGLHEITEGEDHLIHTLDDQLPKDVLENDLRTSADPHDLERITRGDICAAFPIHGLDRGHDYSVRNILELREDGSMMVAHPVTEGANMMFVHRDERALKLDLCERLMDLRQRVKTDRGDFAPRGALYISCMARAFLENKDGENPEMSLISEILGDVPLAGFYAAGEIHNGHLYGYTGILILFL